MLFVTALLLAVAVGACGDGGDDASNSGADQRPRVEATWKRYIGAFVDGDYAKACSLMTTEARAKVAAAGGSCEGTLKLAAGLLDSEAEKKLKNARPTSVRISGDTATVRDSAGGDASRLRRKDGDWLMDSNP